MPEYLRLEADILAARGETFAEQALSAYRRAIQLANEQSALAWELRAAIGLARFYRRRDPQQARNSLLPIYQRFAAGLETIDLVAASQLLDELASEKVARQIV
jgi:hypothetical protein